MKLIETDRKILLTFTFLLVLLLPGCDSEPQEMPVACGNNLDASIQNFCQVTPKVLCRGAKPDKDDAAWLVEHGVRTIVNLELLHDDRAAFEQVRLSYNGRYELGYFRVRDWEPLPVIAPKLSDKHVAHFLAIMSQAPKPVYVHCRSGQNRTGVMVAAYRVIVEGEGDDNAIEKAVKEMEAYQGHWFKADASYIRSLTPERSEKIRRNAKEWMPKLKQEARFVCKAGQCRSYEI